MTGIKVEMPRRFDPGVSALTASSDGPLARAAQDAVARARISAATRLAQWLPVPVVERLGAYFEDAAVHTAAGSGANATPTFELETFLRRLCATPRTVYSAGSDSAAAQVELRTLDGPTAGANTGRSPSQTPRDICRAPAE